MGLGNILLAILFLPFHFSSSDSICQFEKMDILHQNIDVPILHPLL
ncbi:hypothetical protein KR50_29010 [Jeotgalibacillus campisalis]|uniref:Uncharacterized protein n=1 Tax=Jeotgalibacillus campisalis TaxID=220754 RepID=A0A0C2R7I9_9BACL|nr:hypothetical protein KR50_29010 [Jeotgalibacillus campisalis]